MNITILVLAVSIQESGGVGVDAAYRELFEETTIDNCYVEVYVGKLKHKVEVAGDENELYWSELNCDFFDMQKYTELYFWRWQYYESNVDKLSWWFL